MRCRRFYITPAGIIGSFFLRLRALELIFVLISTSCELRGVLEWERLMSVKDLLRSDTFQMVAPALVFVVTLLLGLLLRRLLFRALIRWAQKTAGQIDDIIVHSVRGPFMIWVLMLSIHFAAQVSPLPTKISNLIAKILLFLLVVSLTIVGARLASEVVRVYGSRSQGALPVTSLTQNVVRIVVAIIGILILLNSLGINITPLLTALGVGGLAVALALQDTLANFFAGFYVNLAGNVRPGDYIKLNSGEEGYVSDIGWRSTAMKALNNNIIIVPNSKLAQAIVTNYYLPDKRISFSIPVSVSYESDPDQVEKILLDESQMGLGRIPGLLSEPAPTVRFNPGFGSSSLDFTLICHVSEFVDQYLVQHELRKRILARFRQEGIGFPLPARTVYVRGDQIKLKSDE
jgi:small-conductance mechanosensitive channel